MHIGILGTGFGKVHAELYQKINDLKSITIFGRNEVKLKEIQTNMNVKITTNIEDIINNPDIDIVDICLPNHLHKDYAIKAIENGKNVFCETPLANTLEDALAIKKVADDNQKKVWVNQFIKHEPPYEFLYELIQKETYGKLKALNIRRKTPPLWGDLGLEKIVMNLMIHELDFVTWALGLPNTMNTVGVPHIEGQCHVNVVLQYKDTLVNIEGSSMMPNYHPFKVGFEASFEDATLVYYEDGYHDQVIDGLVLYTNKESKKVTLQKANCYEEALKDVLISHKCNKKSRLHIDYAIDALRLGLEINNQLRQL